LLHSCLFRYNEEMELDDAVHTALLTLREGFEGYVFSLEPNKDRLASYSQT
jgi:hypothetical protein